MTGRRHLPQIIAVACLVACLVALSACAGSTPGQRLAPITLSFADVLTDRAEFPDYRAAADAAADGYVRVRILEPRPPGGLPAPEESERLINAASGTLFDPRGYLVTAAHIAIDTANEAWIVVRDGRLFPARILSVDPDRDLALLWVAPFPGMRPANLAPPGALHAGDPVFAIGAPDNRPGVVSVGRVHTVRLSGRIRYPPYGFANGIRADLAVEPGFSGGPLFNRRGELIGMVASNLLGDALPKVAFAVPSEDLAAYLAEKTAR